MSFITTSLPELLLVKSIYFHSLFWISCLHDGWFSSYKNFYEHEILWKLLTSSSFIQFDHNIVCLFFLFYFIYLFICLFVRLFIYLFICLFIYSFIFCFHFLKCFFTVLCEFVQFNGEVKRKWTQKLQISYTVPRKNVYVFNLAPFANKNLWQSLK